MEKKGGVCFVFKLNKTQFPESVDSKSKILLNKTNTYLAFIDSLNQLVVTSLLSSHTDVITQQILR